MENNYNPNYQQPNNNVQWNGLNKGQVSLLTNSMLRAGIGFICIAIIGFAIAFGLSRMNINEAAGLVTGLFIGSFILIIVAMCVSMAAYRKFLSASKNTIWAMWIIYIIGEGLGFGFLDFAFMLNYGAGSGLAYLMLIFAAGGIAFVMASFIGKSMSLQSTVRLGSILWKMSIAFLVLFFVMILLSIILSFTASGGFYGSGIYTLIIGFGILLFFGYMVYDMSMISKHQAFVGVIEDQTALWKLSMFFGFKLLIDLVGLIWYMASLFLRLKR